MLITTEHLRLHGIERHNVHCTRQFCNLYGIDFKEFVLNGIDHTLLLPAAREREDVAEFFSFMGLEITEESPNETSPLTP